LNALTVTTALFGIIAVAVQACKILTGCVVDQRNVLVTIIGLKKKKKKEDKTKRIKSNF
jgi:hypothetical protein